MKIMWKVFWSMLAGAGIFAFGAMASAKSLDLSACTPQKFKVTAYYSPVPGQSFYYRGNYKDEVILNGKGTHGASGKKVFHGMLAGPASYAFGTKIYFPWWGAGEIADRGWAIVEQGERDDATHDRIDVWVGKGEEGLKRALSFGVQYLDAYICPDGTYVGDTLWLNYDKFPAYEDFFHASLWVLSLRPERRDERVRALQDYLIAMGYMRRWRNTGYYGRETKAGVCKYQQDRLWMTGEEERCGYFWPYTRYHMKYRVRDLWLSDLYGPDREAILPEEEGIAHVEQEAVPLVEEPTQQEVITSNAWEIKLQEPTTLDERIINHMFTKGEFKNYKFLEAMKKGNTGKAVRILQRKLQFLGYRDKNIAISGVYDNKTIQAVYQFQLDHHILTGDEDMRVWGYLGERTREVVNNL